ncbi:MAG: NtaA/DmoA family FMN-dependent monooxygenase [Pseudomonadota bacterium]
MTAKPLRINAFAMNTVGHQSPGLWRHPRDESSRHDTLEHWTKIARTLERGLFDAIFLADVYGVYDVYGGTREAAARAAVQLPISDPFILIPAMAAVTQHLCFGVTGNTGIEPPLAFARRMTTLDHLTRGRLAWNIVTGYLKSAAKAQGQAGLTAHDDRYAIAEDFTSLVYKLWEASWSDTALRRDANAGIYAEPAEIAEIHHDGPHFRFDGIGLGAPSPQRTPVIFQAGASPRGRACAARHAECVFIAGPSARVIAPWVADIRARARAAGRNATDILVFAEITVIPGATEDVACEKHADYARYIDRDGALAMVGGWTGVDFAPMGWDDPIEYEENDALRSHLEAITTADPDKVWTKAALADFAGIGGIAPVITGSAADCARALLDFMDETDIDGFNLAYAVWPESFSDFADLVVPELQALGRYRTAYDQGTMREKLWGRGPRVASTHPAALGKTRP